jgi:hypothetical protein
MRLPGLAIALGLALASPAAAEDAVAALVADLAACLGQATLDRVVVAGLSNDQTALSGSEADRLRLDVEAMLRTAGADITAARDVDRLRGLMEGGGEITATQTEALLETANAGDAVVFIVEPARLTGSVRFRLQAITPDAACKVTSPEIETALSDGGANAVDRVIEAALEDFLNTAPDTESLGVCPVVSEAGYSSCAPALTDSLAAAALAKAQDPARALTGRTLAVTRLDRAACSATPEVPTTYARLSTDAAGETWLDLQVRSGNATLAALPRTRVDLSSLGCDPAPRPLIDYVALTANRDTARLDITAPPFAAGQLLDVRIDLGREAPLYCWVIAPDETAFVLLPVGEMAPWSAGSYSYPADFGLQSVVLNGAFENLFHCFAPDAALPPELAARWREATAGAAGPTLLDSLALATLLDDMRAQPGMIEAATRLIVR